MTGKLVFLLALLATSSAFAQERTRTPSDSAAPAANLADTPSATVGTFAGTARDGGGADYARQLQLLLGDRHSAGIQACLEGHEGLSGTVVFAVTTGGEGCSVALQSSELGDDGVAECLRRTVDPEIDEQVATFCGTPESIGVEVTIPITIASGDETIQEGR